MTELVTLYITKPPPPFFFLSFFYNNVTQYTPFGWESVEGFNHLGKF